MVIEIRIDRLYTENRARNERCVCVIFSPGRTAPSPVWFEGYVSVCAS